MTPIRPLFALLLFPPLSMAQWLAVGVTGGVPISPQSQDSGTGFFTNGVSGPNDLIVRPYLIGATVQAKLRWKLSAVAEFQYQRIHEDFTYSNVKNGATIFGIRGGASANDWLFPLLLRYDIDRRRVSPFVDLGATLRRVGPFDGTGFQLNFNLQPQPMSFHIVPGGNPEIAITAGGGIGTRMSIFDLETEVRFLHWTASYYIPAQNQAVLTVSATFPARRK